MTDERKSDDREPRKPGRPPDRVSLKPLEFEEALADLLATEIPEREHQAEPDKKKGRQR